MQNISKIGEHVSFVGVNECGADAYESTQQIFLAGLALQLFSFFLFVLVALRFIYRVRTMEPEAWTMDRAQPWHRNWRTLVFVLIVSSVGILVRPSLPFICHWATS